MATKVERRQQLLRKLAALPAGGAKRHETGVGAIGG
jgi:hypothetical protein